MSADNFYTVVPHPDGGYAAVMGFASDDDQPVVATDDHHRFATVGAAWIWASEQYSEYGVRIDPSLYETLFGTPITDPVVIDAYHQGYIDGAARFMELAKLVGTFAQSLAQVAEEAAGIVNVAKGSDDVPEGRHFRPGAGADGQSDAACGGFVAG